MESGRRIKQPNRQKKVKQMPAGVNNRNEPNHLSNLRKAQELEAPGTMEDGGEEGSCKHRNYLKFI